MARRAAFVKKLRSGSLLQLDSGGFSQLNTKDGIIRTQALMAIHDEIGMAAVNVTTEELSSDANIFLEMEKTSKTPYLSANIFYKETKLPVFKTHKILIKNNKKIAVIGVTSNSSKIWPTSGGREIMVVDPVESIERIVKEVEGKVDLVILLADIPRRKIAALISKVNGINLVLGSDGYSVTREVTKIRNTRVNYAGKQGEYLATLAIRMDDKEIYYHDHQLVRFDSREYPEDPEIKNVVDRAFDRIEELRTSVAMTISNQVNSKYEGNSACNNCHSKQVGAWRLSKHYSSYDGLLKPENVIKEKCYRCHTTGYKDGGFVSEEKTPMLAKVACEACHGYGVDHIYDPKNKTMQKKPNEDTCLSCHDKENSPNFVYKTYWEKIKH